MLACSLLDRQLLRLPRLCAQHETRFDHILDEGVLSRAAFGLVCSRVCLHILQLLEVVAIFRASQQVTAWLVLVLTMLVDVSRDLYHVLMTWFHRMLVLILQVVLVIDECAHVLVRLLLQLSIRLL